MERNQIHYEPPEETGDDPFHETATAWQMPIKVGKGKARGSRPIEIRKQPGHQGMNIFPSPVTQRRLEALIGLKGFKYTEFGFTHHEQCMRDASAKPSDHGFPYP